MKRSQIPFPTVPLCTVKIAAMLAAVFLATSPGKAPSQERALQVQPSPGGELINDVEQAKVAAHDATPYIETSTFGLIDIDITKINMSASATWLKAHVGQPLGQDVDQAVLMASGFLESMKTAGVAHVYITASTRSLIDGGPLVVVPCQNPAVVNGLAAMMLQIAPKESAQKTHVGDQLVLAGAQSAVDRVLKAQGAKRGDLILPMKEKGRLDHALVLSLPEESRRELIAIWPDRLPAEAPFQFSPRQMASDINRVVVSFRLPPEPQVVARIETLDASSAERVKEVVEQVIALSPEAKDGIEIDLDIRNVVLKASPEMFAKVVQALAAPARRSATQMQRMNTLKQLGLAMHNYFATEKHLPPRCLTDRKGKPLLSWRVTLLPYLEQNALYDAYKLDEAWDSAHNEPLGQTALPLLINDGEPAKTRYRVPVFPGSIWQGEGPPKEFKDVIDGTSQTIAMIYAPADAAVEWSNPEPWVISAEDPMSDVFGDRDRVEMVFLDGAARTFKKEELDNAKLKALLTYAGREVVEW